MDLELINFLFTALIGIALIPICFIGPVYLFELWWAKRQKK